MDNKAFHQLSYGVYLCTAWDEGRPVGCVANSAMQITSSPATIAVSINRDNYTHKCIVNSGYFSICVMSEKCNPELIGKFGFRSSKDFEKFEGVAYRVRDKLPIPDDGVCYFSLKVIERMETATHTVFLGEVIGAEMLKGGTPMTYAYYHRVLKGKTAKNAPTYVEGVPDEPTAGAKWVCDICGYEYDGDIPFEDLPADWVCPLCGMGKESFTKKTSAETPKAKWVCDICGYEYDGDIPFEDLPADWVCPLCGMGKEHFSKK